MSFEIDIACPDRVEWVQPAHLRRAVTAALSEEQVAEAVISVTVVDNKTIHRLNRDYLQHDYPTDVISFQLDWSAPGHTAAAAAPDGRSANASIEGEIVAGWQYAAAMAEEGGWLAEHELTLYVIHGLLHICGYDDQTDKEKRIMRARERRILQTLGLSPVYPGDGPEAQKQKAAATRRRQEDSQ